MDDDIVKKLLEPLEMIVTPEMEEGIKNIKDFYDEINKGCSLKQVANADMLSEYLGTLLEYLEIVVPSLKSYEDPEHWPQWKKDLAEAQDNKYRLVDRDQGISQS